MPPLTGLSSAPLDQSNYTSHGPLNLYGPSPNRAIREVTVRLKLQTG